jgi:hypothetical protein
MSFEGGATIEDEPYTTGQTILPYGRDVKVGRAGGRLGMELQTHIKANYTSALNLLIMQLRRMDVEMKHVTGNRDIREFETDLLRVIQLGRQAVLIGGIFGPVLFGTAEGGLAGILAATGYGAPLAALMLGMSATTSALTMSELS